MLPHRRDRWPSAALPALAVAAALAAGCGREPIIAYEVPKEAPPAGARMPPNHPPVGAQRGGAGGGKGAMAPPAGVEVPRFDLPAGWVAGRASGMRSASLSAGEGDAAVDISIVRLAGSGGGLAGNFNRWRRQVGLPPEEPETLLASLTPIDIAGARAHKALFVGPDGGKAILGAALARGGASWFFKLTGKAAAVRAQSAAFDRWLASVRFGPGAAPSRDAAPTGGGEPAAAPAAATATGPKGGADVGHK